MRGAPASLWYRAHLRQALTLGVLLTLVLVVVLAVPLILSLALGGDPMTTIRIYIVGIVVDLVAFGAAAIIVAAAALRAARGEMLDLPVVRRLSERLTPRP
ncbi:MAG: hypothetical protein JO101_07950 [Candidatus Eremiobacteraeota bacterium]|nr:hypothetical protein [Candidatus Eremiobacteraeota bacterium]MBV8355236.1 hypothetical protein [Candidatus Eremiobacteraeota bacterium]